MQRKVNQAIFAILAMTTIWLTVHASKINSMSPDVKVLNRNVNSMMNRLIELESKPVETISYYEIYEEQNRFIEGFESSLSFKDTFLIEDERAYSRAAPGLTNGIVSF